MTLKNKDGSRYSLRKPNPLTQTQILLDKKKIVLHNFRWGDKRNEPEPVEQKYQPAEILVSPSKGEKAPPPPKTAFVEESPVIVPAQPVEVPVVEAPVVESPVMEQEIPADETPSINSIGQHIKNRVIFYCLPVIEKSSVDPLYNEMHHRMTYGKKFTFEGVMVDMEDLAIHFWTDAPPVIKGCIVFPARWDDGIRQAGFKSYRWWRVSEREIEGNGYLIRATATHIQPDFS